MIPVLCLSLWAGTWLGTWLVGPIQPEAAPIELPGDAVVQAGADRVQAPIDCRAEHGNAGRAGQRLHVDPAAFGPSLWAVGGLLFAISGYTMALSACGRYRWRVLGLAVFVTLVQFLDQRGRPDCGTCWRRSALDDLLLLPAAGRSSWASRGPAPGAAGLAVLYGVGAAGYAVALGCSRGGICRRRCKHKDTKARQRRQ